MGEVLRMLSEKQVQPVVQYALNRAVFKVPHEQWIREVDLWNKALMDYYVAEVEAVQAGEKPYKVRPLQVRLDLVCLVHSGAFSAGRIGQGFHGVEVKMAKDKDRRRLERQLVGAMGELDFVWLCVVDGDPVWEDRRVGLVRYDLLEDRITVVRRPERIVDARHERVRWALSFGRRMDKTAERAAALVPKALVNRKGEVEAAVPLATLLDFGG